MEPLCLMHTFNEYNKGHILPDPCLSEQEKLKNSSSLVTVTSPVFSQPKENESKEPLQPKKGKIGQTAYKVNTKKLKPPFSKPPFSEASKVDKKGSKEYRKPPSEITSPKKSKPTDKPSKQESLRDSEHLSASVPALPQVPKILQSEKEEHTKITNPRPSARATHAIISLLQSKSQVPAASASHKILLNVTESTPSSSTGLLNFFGCSFEIPPKKIRLYMREDLNLRQKVLIKESFKTQAVKDLNEGNAHLALDCINKAFRIVKICSRPSFIEDALLIKIEIAYSKKYPQFTTTVTPKSIRANIQAFIEKYQIGIETDPAKLDIITDIVKSFLKLDPKDTFMLNYLGVLLAKQGKVFEAIDTFKKTLKLDQHDMFALRSSASIYLMQRDPNKAMKCITLALEWSSKDQATLKIREEVMKLIEAEKAPKASVSSS